MKFITCSTRHLDDNLDLSIRRQPQMLRESARQFDVSFVNIGFGGEHAWTGIPRRKYLRSYLEGLPNPEVVVFADAYDSFLSGTAGEVKAAFLTFDKPVVFSAEVNLYPGEMAQYVTYPPAPTRFAYVNGGGFAGEAGALRAMFDAPDFWQPPCNCDQWAFGDWYTKHPDIVAVDHHCRLFQTLYHEAEKHAPPPVVDVLEIRSGRLHNAETDSYPLICHGNGGRAMEALQLWQQIKR